MNRALVALALFLVGCSAPRSQVVSGSMGYDQYQRQLKKSQPNETLALMRRAFAVPTGSDTFMSFLVDGRWVTVQKEK